MFPASGSYPWTNPPPSGVLRFSIDPPFRRLFTNPFTSQICLQPHHPPSIRISPFWTYFHPRSVVSTIFLFQRGIWLLQIYHYLARCIIYREKTWSSQSSTWTIQSIAKKLIDSIIFRWIVHSLQYFIIINIILYFYKYNKCSVL